MRALTTFNPRTTFLLSVLATTVGCSGSSSDGGSTSSGGTTSTGGTPSTGTAATTGGYTTASGGVTYQSATVSTGGVTSGSGTVSTGGTKATGGTFGSTGGVTFSTGGQTNATGGFGTTGGTTAKTSPSTGGKSSTGGTPSTGGNSSVSACPSPALAAGDTTKTITVGGLSRQYILHVPSAYKGNAAVPLVVDFHPIGGSMSAWRTGSPYPAVIDGEGVISAFPNGESGPMGNAWNVEGCCVSKSVDDVAFAKALVADVEKVACIDPKRVYAVGFSMGGGMSHYLGCHAADVFAAIGPASFDLIQQNVTGCTPTRPLSVIFWRGKTDSVVPYAGGHSALVSGMAIDFLGAVATFEKWASLDKCTGTASAADANGCQTYSNCGGGTQVTLCTNNSGGHEAAKASVTWPMLKKYTLP